jgi:hypothetical protein
MNMRSLPVLLLAGFAMAGLLRAKDRKPSVPEVMGRAHTAYVEAAEGQQFDRNLDPDEREAIADVQDALQAWKRYKLVTQREDADIVFVVRKGQVLARDGAGDLGGPSQNPSLGGPGSGPGGGPGSGPGFGGAQMPGQRGPGQGGSGPVAEPSVTEDVLEVCLVNADGKLTSPVWARSLEAGLNGPQVRLFRQLRDEVDKAYPIPPPAQPVNPQSPQPTNPQPQQQPAPQPQQPENPQP